MLRVKRVSALPPNYTAVRDPPDGASFAEIPKNEGGATRRDYRRQREPRAIICHYRAFRENEAAGARRNSALKSNYAT